MIWKECGHTNDRQVQSTCNNYSVSISKKANTFLMEVRKLVQKLKNLSDKNNSSTLHPELQLEGTNYFSCHKYCKIYRYNSQMEFLSANNFFVCSLLQLSPSVFDLLCFSVGIYFSLKV